MFSLSALSVEFEDKWPQLEDSFERIMNLQKISRSKWQDGIRQVYCLSRSLANPATLEIYEATKKFLEQLAVSRCQEIICATDVLGSYERQWKKYRDGLDLLHIFLGHVHMESVKRARDFLLFEVDQADEVLDIKDLGLVLWKANVIYAMREKLPWFLCEIINSDRAGKCNNPGLVQAVINSLLDVGALDMDPTEIYRELFETRFLSDSEEYYRAQTAVAIQNYDCPDYMVKVLHWMHDEKLRSTKFLHPSTIPKVSKLCVETMVIDQLKYLLCDIKGFIKQEVKTDYKNMYTLLKLAGNGLDDVLPEMQAHITQVGCNAMMSINENNPEVFVETFLGVRDKYLTLINACFDSDKKFIGALDKACVAILKCDGHNVFADKSAEIVAAYCDRMFKKHARDSDEARLEDELSQAIIVFNYIQDKDVFQRFYSQMLCRRLLHGTAESLSVEEIMIAKLKRSCGYEFTRKYDEMFTDVNLKKSLNEEFSRFNTSHAVELGFTFEAAVLRSSSWPCLYNTFPFAVPQVVERCVIQFDLFYKGKYSGRKLMWLHQISSAELKLCYLPKTYVISVTTYQMALLLLFEKSDQLTLGEMKESTQLDDERLCKVIRSLTEARLLIAGDDSVYLLNKKYSNKKLRFRIPPVARNDRKAVAQEEVKRVRELADDGRRYVLEAAIVRVMKARISLRHNQLTEEVIKQVSHCFSPSISMIKKCIERLIDKGYLERSPESASEYWYIA